MSVATEETLVVAGDTQCRIWTKGQGEPIGFLGGLGGVPRWPTFLNRLAETRKVVVISPPGFPGSGAGHKNFEGYLDWITVTLDLIEEAGLVGADLMGASVGGLLAAEAAGMAPSYVGRLILAAPFGIYDVTHPGVDPFALTADATPGVLSADLVSFVRAFGPPDDPDMEVQVKWAVMLAGAADAAASILWPFGDCGLRRRLHRIRSETLILWGERDVVLPPSYAEIYAAGITGPTKIVKFKDAGHLVYVDEAELTADHVLSFFA